MKLLKCKICLGEVDVIGNDRSINRKVKCHKCNPNQELDSKGPEVIIIRKRPKLD